MRHIPFVTFFIGIHIIGIFLQVYLHTRVVHYSFLLQKQEKEYMQLSQQKQQLTNKLYALNNKDEIGKYAASHLQMKPLTLAQIRHTSHDH